jgi:hypothetical protein
MELAYTRVLRKAVVGPCVPVPLLPQRVCTHGTKRGVFVNCTVCCGSRSKNGEVQSFETTATYSIIAAALTNKKECGYRSVLNHWSSFALCINAKK